ncbi:MAG: LLM class flavin-dependent oxidoreductase [Streptosporangiales bacterium]|nr:LLM class flavin-dependent oxidoreductase [Streptosporangiales bacterium]
MRPDRKEDHVEVGILVAPGAETPGLVARAEGLGFASAFFVDSPVLFGDLYVSMAACAARTSRILLVTGVTNPLTRTAPVTASALASLNAYAPRRVGMGIGVGFTATRAMGQRSATLAELERYVAQVRGLLRGEVVDVAFDDDAVPVQLLNQTRPWFDLEDEIPVYMAAAGPKALALAGQIADAVILGGIANTDVIAACREILDQGARKVGRTVDDIRIAITPSVYVTDEPPRFEHLRATLGPKSLAPALTFSRIAEQSPLVPRSVADDLAAVRLAYRPDDEPGGDERSRHLRAYRGYMTELKEWQVPLITPSVLEATSIAGTPDECYRKLTHLGRNGVDHVVLSPLPQHADAVVESFGGIIPRLP